MSDVTLRRDDAALLGGLATLAVLLVVLAVPRPRVIEPAREAPPPRAEGAPPPVATPAPAEAPPVAAPPTAEALARRLEEAGIAWPPPPGARIPPLYVERLPPDLDRLPVARKKALFFRTLLPLVLAENRRILAERRRLLALLAAGRLEPGSAARGELEALARRYRVFGDVNDPAVREELLRRVDVVPPALALAQAAIESGWGASRFAREANNLFGIWTWTQARGLRPREAAADARHRVRVYPDLRSAVRAYLHNLNVGHAYGLFRRLRAFMRAQGEPLDPVVLAYGLRRYSARGADYVREVQRLIRANRLTLADRTELAG
ncbi:glucosaminidase domain-containing protein [Inmirania thermothiophila]|uniref:Bax protein n=1 Tax=Inmirania thermothiophila TaxID=1750597 RepID=A0A3N1XTL8_9GAMM|nr:glucosaminidase domain-containing protein [Inmirania thermothiophila]ROR29511.1 Bax protein [Inmirania thermothiophila]